MARGADLALPAPATSSRRNAIARAREAGGWASAWRPHDPVRWAIWLLVIMTVSRANGEFAFLTPFRPLLVLTAIALGLAVLNPKLLSRLPWAKTWPARVVMGLGAAACLSAVFGMSVGGSARFILDSYSKTLLLAFLVMATIRSPRDIHMYIWAYVISCGIIAGFALRGGYVEVGYYSGMERLSRFMSTYDANDVGVVLLIGIPLSIYTFQMSRVRGKLVSLLVVLGIGYTIAKTGSRGAFVGLVATGAGIMVLIDSISVARKIGFMLATLLAIAVASPEGYWSQMATILRPTQDYNWDSEGGRIKVIGRGLGYMSRYPIFGIGVGNFPMAEGTVSHLARDRRLGDPGVQWKAAHNSFLQATVEMGVVGCVLWFTLIFKSIWSLSQMGQRLPRKWRLGNHHERVLYHSARYVPVAVIAFASSGFFVSFAYLDPIYLLTALGVGLLGIIAATPGAVASRTRGRLRGSGRPAAQPVVGARAHTGSLERA